MNKDGELVMKHEKWTDQHDMSIGQRKKVCVPNRNETRDLLNIRQASALSIKLWKLMESKAI